VLALQVRRGSPATSVFVLIVGSAHTYAADPAHFASDRLSIAAGLMPSAEAFSLLTPTATLRVGEVVGGELEVRKHSVEKVADGGGEEEEGNENGDAEEESEEPMHRVTAIANAPVELMEVDRLVYERIARGEGLDTSQTDLFDCLSQLKQLEGAPTEALRRLAAVATARSFTRGQLCLAHPPAPALGAASSSDAVVTFFVAGEAKLMCHAHAHPPPTPSPMTSDATEMFSAPAPRPSSAAASMCSESPPSAEDRRKERASLESDKDAVSPGSTPNGSFHKRAPPKLAVDGRVYGPHAEGVAASSAAVERHVGGAAALVSVASLAAGECVVGSLFPCSHTRWCLCVTTSKLDVLVVPRDVWGEVVHAQVLATQQALAEQRASFFASRLAQVQSIPASPLQLLPSPPKKPPKWRRGRLGARTRRVAPSLATVFKRS
jgi:hypothetical protein